MRATSRRRLVALVILWGVVTCSIAAASGCYGRNCEGDAQSFKSSPGDGRLIDPDTWESNPVDEGWVPFPKQRAWFFEIGDFADRTPDLVVPYISAEEFPLRDHANFTIGSGNITEISGAENGRVVIRNGTCADYYLRLVVRSAARPQSNDAGDADADASSDASDAADSSDAEGGI